MADTKYQKVALRNISYRVTFRQVSFRDMVIREWGDEWAQNDHDIYEWSNGRTFDSTDKGTTGIYNGQRTVVLDSIILQNFYLDTPAHLVQQGVDQSGEATKYKIRFQQSPRLQSTLLDASLNPFVLGSSHLG